LDPPPDPALKNFVRKPNIFSDARSENFIGIVRATNYAILWDDGLQFFLLQPQFLQLHG
jgi:hypothetical protein